MIKEKEDLLAQMSILSVDSNPEKLSVDNIEVKKFWEISLKFHSTQNNGNMLIVIGSLLMWINIAKNGKKFPVNLLKECHIVKFLALSATKINNYGNIFVPWALLIYQGCSIIYVDKLLAPITMATQTKNGYFMVLVTVTFPRKFPKWHILDAYETILKDGFDHRVANLGGAIGAGIYFGVSSGTSSGYVSGKKKMLYCRVTLGSVGPGQHGLRRPPEKSKGKLHDSVGDHHTMYVVFDNYQAYPEYVIYYK